MVDGRFNQKYQYFTKSKIEFSNLTICISFQNLIYNKTVCPKSMLTLVLGFKKKIESDYKTKYDTFYLKSKAEAIINENDIDDVFESVYTTIISNIQKSLGKG